MQELEDKKRVIGFVVLFGFETKNFFGSGLYTNLSALYESVIFRREFLTQHFNEYIKQYDLNVTVLEKKNLSKKRLKSENLFLASRRAYNRLKHVENFNYFRSDREKKIFDYILGHSLVQNFLKMVTRIEIRQKYFNKDLKKSFDNKKVTDLIMAGYSSSESITLATTASFNHCNMWLIINSWKDFYVNNFIPFTPKKVFVWSYGMKEQILNLNNHICASSIVVSGNPSFDRFFEYQPMKEKNYYAKKYGFNKNRPFILYSMISPKAYPYEKEIIELINQKMIEQYDNEESRPIILLRANPIDETLQDDLYFTGNNVKYTENYFEGSYENAIFVQLNEGEIEWMDLLYYADININIASTVTLEALMMKTPVINVEFDSTGKKDESLIRYSQAPFYKSLYHRNDVKIVQNIEDCLDNIDKFLKKDFKIDGFKLILEYFDGKATKRIMEEIKNG